MSNLGRRIPTAGHPTRWQAVAALYFEDGLRAPEIAKRLGLLESTVSSHIDYARKKRGLPPLRKRRPSETAARTVAVPRDVLAALGPAAARRGITINELARQLLEAIADDDIVDAVLDDGAVPDGRGGVA